MSAAVAIAVVGGGAIAERFYLPALTRHPATASSAFLVEPEEHRREALGQRFRLAGDGASLETVVGQVAAVIVCAPPPHHCELSLLALRSGAHVLCEKPLALTLVEAKTMVQAAEQTGLTLAVNQTRRLFPAAAEVQRRIGRGDLGRLRRLTYREGQPFEWPAATASYFRGTTQGVVLDRGAHVLDLVCWWLGAEPRLSESLNDSFGGPEAAALLRLSHQECEVEIRLSWLHRLQNRFLVEGEGGALAGDIYDWTSFEVRQPDGSFARTRLRSPVKTFEGFADLLVDGLVRTAQGRGGNLVAAADVLPSIALLERSYETARRFHLPWTERSGDLAT